MEIYKDEKVRVMAGVTIETSFCVHDLKTGEEEWQDTEEFAGVKTQKDGKVYVRYYTGWDDCPIEGYYVRETEEEVKRLWIEARSKVYDCDEYIIVKKENKQ
jgi:hypothetical protein